MVNVGPEGVSVGRKGAVNFDGQNGQFLLKHCHFGQNEVNLLSKNGQVLSRRGRKWSMWVQKESMLVKKLLILVENWSISLEELSSCGRSREIILD